MKMCGGEAKRIDQEGNGGSYSREPCRRSGWTRVWLRDLDKLEDLGKKGKIYE